MSAPTCPVTIFNVTCGNEIGEGEGELVMLADKGWLVCQSCALRGVHELDVAHAAPAIDLGASPDA